MRRCLSCHRTTSGWRRGCCHACYERYILMVERQELTWADLEAQGHARPPLNRTAEWRAQWAAAHPITEDNPFLDL
jgi:hypothetical protein